MNKIKSLEDLYGLHRLLEGKMSIREKSERMEDLICVRVGLGDCGLEAGARGIMNFLMEYIEVRKIPALVIPCDCMGCCAYEPTVEVVHPGRFPIVFGKVDRVKAEAIVRDYIVGGKLPEGVTVIEKQSKE